LSRKKKEELLVEGQLLPLLIEKVIGGMLADAVKTEPVKT